MKAEEITSEIKPASPGMPQFILGYTKGKTRPLLTLYDTGCLSVLFKTGVPEKELSPAVLKCKGPIYVNGVGNTNIQVNDEYMCTVPLADGSRAVLEGLTVNDITAALPMTSLVKAENILKNDGKNNKVLQSLKCYPSVGGQCDILLGIRYSNLLPKPVHTLENGLTIYKLVISSHDSKYNATIGGPHESFDSFANYIGGIPVFMANMQVQLDNYIKFGPPKLNNTLLSNEDIMFSKQHNKLKADCHEDLELPHIIDEESFDAPMDQNHDDDSMDRDNDGADASLKDCQSFVCSQRGEKAAENEDQRLLRSLQKVEGDSSKELVKFQKVRKRIKATNHHFNPAKFSVNKTIRVLRIVKFIKSFKSRKRKLSKSNHRSLMLSAMVAENSLQPTNNKAVVGEEKINHGYIQVGAKDPGGNQDFHVKASDDDDYSKAHCTLQSHGRNAKPFVSVRGASEDEYEELLEDETMIRSTDSLSSLLIATHLDLETTLMPGHTTL